MTGVTVELRALAWLMIAVIVAMLAVWAARYAPWLLWLPAWGHRQRWRRWWRRRAFGRGELA